MDECRRKTIIQLWIIDSGLDTHIFKGAIRFLMIKSVSFTFQSPRSTQNRHTPKLAEVLSHISGLGSLGGAGRQVVEIEIEVAGNKKIQSAIAIIIAPGRASAPTFARNAQLLSHVGEGTVAVVVIKPRDAKVADEDIGSSVIIIVAHRHAHSPWLIRHSRFGGHVFELPITPVVVQPRA